MTRRFADGTMEQSVAVQLLRWPAVATRRGPAERPCLWLLPPGELPPLPNVGEDWIRLPADERDVAVRLRQLAERPEGAEGPREHPDHEIDEIDETGRLERNGTIVLLPPIEADLFRVLAAHVGRVATREVLTDGAWTAAPSGRALDGRMHALRRHLEPIGLVVHTIRGRGFLLAVADPDLQVDRERIEA